jgi:hypothetical protein
MGMFKPSWVLSTGLGADLSHLFATHDAYASTEGILHP